MNDDPVETLRLPGFSVDLVQSTLTDAQGRLVPLRPQSAAVLRLLGQHANQLVSKQTLMQEIWAGTIVTDDSLVQCIKEIRHALDDHQHQIIQTLPKHGYKLVMRAPPAEPVAVERLDPPPRQGAWPAPLLAAALVVIVLLVLVLIWGLLAGQVKPS